MGSGSGSFLRVVLNNFDVLAGPLISLVYPLYASVRAIETRSPVDDQQWLTYWVLYSMITLFEMSCYKVLEWIPFWPYVKLILICWLAIPYFSGAAYVYQHFLRPFFVSPRQTVNAWYVPGTKDAYGKQDDTSVGAEKYMVGPEAYEQIVNRGDKSLSSGHSAFDDDDQYNY